jgi:chromosome segregation ATPase
MTSKRSSFSEPSGTKGTTQGDVTKIQQDISIVNQRIAELRGDALFSANPTANSDSSSSGFVVGLRNLADSERKNKDAKEIKITALESLLEKIAEFDRVVLQKTLPITDPAAVPVRRKSAGLDLYTLPTHLHITDRLMDLYTQSKRVTVITKTSTQSNPSVADSISAADKKVIETQKAQIVKLSAQCEDCEQRRIKSENECAQLRRESEELRCQLLESATKIPQISLAPASLSGEVATLTTRIKTLEAEVTEQQEQLENEASRYQSILTVVYGKASRIDSGRDISPEENGSDCANLVRHCLLSIKFYVTIKTIQPENMRTAFQSLEMAIARRLQGLRSEVHLLHSVKELLEGEIASSNLQRDMLGQDVSTLTAQLTALKGAYHELSFETASSKIQEINKQDNNDLSLQNQLKDANNNVIQLQTQLYDANRKLSDLVKVHDQYVQTETALTIMTEKCSVSENVVSGQVEEIKQYKRLTDTLKDKIKEMGSSRGSQDAKDFLDSFEEVMREEMLTMKGAFETKLRLAKEAADATSRRHQQEILRIHTSSPYSTIKRL